MKKKTDCAFWRNSACALRRRCCCLCVMHFRSVEGIDEIKDYIDVVSARKLAARSLVISCITILISLLALFVSIAKQVL